MKSHSHITIIGSGFGGLGMAIRLKMAGHDDFVILERAADVGGVWRDNTYPGCACDIESHLYSYSFAPNPGWSHMFSRQAEIWAYLKDCAKRFGILPHLRFQHELHKATWDGALRQWVLITSQGTLTTRFIISGMGALSEPAIPDIPGLDRFKGKVFHSAQWDHEYDLNGRRIGVVGTGASAIQFIPEIQAKVSQLLIFQRTAPWVLPRLDRPLSGWEKALFAQCPITQKLGRLRIYVTREIYGLVLRRRRLMRLVKWAARRHLRKSITGATLRAKVTPSYEMGCKRILISNDYYPALTKDNVQLLTADLREVTDHAIVTRDGKAHELDAIIFGTGFQVTDLPSARRIFGKNGRDLLEHMGASPKAHLGTTFLGFPNFFMLQGPSTGLGHNSVVMMIEHQITHILKAIQHLRKVKATSLEPSPSALAAFVADVDRKMRGTVWTAGGCQSWYLDKTGRNSTLWPSSVSAFARRMARFDPAEFIIER